MSHLTWLEWPAHFKSRRTPLKVVDHRKILCYTVIFDLILTKMRFNILCKKKYIYIFVYVLIFTDIIRQPSEDEIIKLAPPPKKVWGWSLWPFLLCPWHSTLSNRLQLPSLQPRVVPFAHHPSSHENSSTANRIHKCSIATFWTQED